MGQCFVGCSTISNFDHYYTSFLKLPSGLTLQAPEPALSQFPVTNYNIMYASGEGDSHSETVPADTTSYNLPVVAGVQYTITVSALSNGRESQNNPQLNFGMFGALFLKTHHVKMSLFIFVFNYKIANREEGYLLPT